MTDEKGLDVTAGDMVCAVTMPEVCITRDSDVVKALVCASAADHRTVKRWILEPHRVHVGTAHLLTMRAAELGLTERVEAMRGAAR